MRQTIRKQAALPPAWVDHPKGKELLRIDQILAARPEVVGLIYLDLTVGVDAGNGRPGLSARQALRCSLLKQITQASYRQLAFHLMDSRSYRRFCGFGLGDPTPSASSLQRTLKKISSQTWEQINRLLVRQALEEGKESGERVRGDCTVVPSNVLRPADSRLLWDSIRTLASLLAKSKTRFGCDTAQLREAKRAHTKIFYAKRKAQRVPAYAELVRHAEEVVAKARRARSVLARRVSERARSLGQKIDHFLTLAERVLSQTKRRIFAEEKVPASDKIVSIFEPHTDIVVKSWRETYYGHKISVVAGSRLILDVHVEDGNPCDSILGPKMIARTLRATGVAPKQVAFDGGFASRPAAKALHELGVRDVCFSKRRDMSLEDLVQCSRRTYDRLRKFRAGIEGLISFLKRAFGLRCCVWSGRESFDAFVWSGVVAANLRILARL